MSARRNLRILRRMTAANVAMCLVYRGHFALFMLANVTVPLVSLLVWRAALAAGAQLPVGKDYLTTYFVLLSLVTMATSSWMAAFLSEDIRLGRLSTWMVRPASLLYPHLANNLSEKLLKAAMLLPMIGALAVVFSDSLRIPPAGWRWLLFVLSTVLGAVIVFAIDIVVGALAFWFDDTAGLDRARGLLSEILSGSIVPLALMPAWSQGFVTVQPFRFTVSFPVEIMSGSLPAHELVAGFGLQIGYAVVACLAARWVWKVGIRAYSAVGA